LPVNFFAGYDYITMHGFNREYLRSSVLAGEFPWWNPFTALGRPFFADIETACAYPPTWLIFPFGVTGGVIAGVALHCWLAIYGIFRLSTALGVTPLWARLAALTYVLSGPVLARLQLGQLDVFFALCWLPWLFRSGLQIQDEAGRRAIVQLAAIECACLLVGSPNVFWVSNCGLIIFLGCRAPTWSKLWSLGWALSCSLLLALSVAALQLLPFLELILSGNRPVQASLYASRFGMHATTWLSLVLPGGRAFGVAPEFNQHLGAPLALGGMAALVFHWRDKNMRALLGLAAWGFVLGSGDQLPVLGWLARTLPGFGAMRYPSRYGVLVALALLLAASVMLSRLSFPSWRRWRWLLVSAQLALLGFAAVQFSIRSRTRTTGFWDADLRADLASHGLFSANGVPPRVSFDPEHLRANSGLVEGYSTLGGFANPMLRTVWTAAHSEAGVAAPDYNFFQLNPEIYHTGPFPMASATLVAGWDPRSATTVMRSTEEAGPRAWISISGQTDQSPPPILPGSVVLITKFTRNTVTLSIHAPTRALVVLAEPAYPGWRMSSGENEQPAIQIGSWMRGGEIAGGDSIVRFHFLPRWLGIGALLSTLGLAAGIFCWVYRGAHGRLSST
jgi:hypothetical protein